MLSKKEVSVMTSHESPRLELPLSGKVAIVTGSGRGIGAATALHLADLGSDVVVNYLNNSEAAQEVRDQIVGKGRRSIAIGADVSTPSGADSLATAALDEFGRIDILVSNAGPFFRPISLVDMTWDDFGGLLNQDLQAAFNSTKAVLPTMIESHFGRIVYVGSASAYHPTPGLAHHGSARASISTFSAYVAKEMGEYGITSNVVSPGMVRTERTAAAGDMIARMDAMTPAGRIAAPGDVARAIGVFADDAEGFFTGTNFPVDGGLTAGR